MQQFEMYYLTNRHHDRMKALRRRRKERIQERVYQVAKNTLAFGGCMLFLACLWMLAS